MAEDKIPCTSCGGSGFAAIQPDFSKPTLQCLRCHGAGKVASNIASDTKRKPRFLKDTHE